VDDARLATPSFHRLAEFVAQMPNREAAHIPAFDPLQMGPAALAGVQLWGIGGERWLRWMGAPSRIITGGPGTSRSRCARNATTSSASRAQSWL
jgi:hypothetical protein